MPIPLRRETRKIDVGDVPIGKPHPITVQSMTNADPSNPHAVLEQIHRLAAAGCDIVRATAPDIQAAHSFKEICADSPIPVIADVHFDVKIAVAALDAGAPCIRINPGNLKPRSGIREIAAALKANSASVRVGVNGGSLDKDLYLQHGGSTAEALAESAIRQCRELEDLGIDQIKVSLKASDVNTTFLACKLFADKTDYPMHIGVTEAGTVKSGVIKSSAGIGALLLNGIGDTIRVSLTADPVEEVKIGIQILEAVGIRQPKPEIVSCPTCGRTQIPLIELTEKVENAIEAIKSDGFTVTINKIAVMGCIVNGPGEASDADLGIAGGKGKAALFKKGKIIRTLKEEEILPELIKEIRKSAVKQQIKSSTDRID